MKFLTFWEAFELPTDKKNYEVNTAPSLTVDDGYEDLVDMIPRIIRGDVPVRQLSYELQGDIVDDDFDRPVVDNLDDLTDIDSSKIILETARSSASPRAEEAPAAGSDNKSSAAGSQPSESEVSNKAD